MSHEISQSVFQFTITLNDSSPRVWRRILVPSTYSFFELHVAIQSAMGWSDCHLHNFALAQKGTVRPLLIEFPNPDSDPWDDHQALDERLEKIADYFGVKVKQCQYCYDFGDGWDHTIVFEGEMPATLGESYPVCAAGKNTCPPEDCGGVGGYEFKQEIMRDVSHPEHNDIRLWLGLEEGEKWDNTRFDPSQVKFVDPVELLERYENECGFQSSAQSHDTSVTVAKRIDTIARQKLPHSGCWELDQRPEPVFGKGLDGLTLKLTTVVHQEARFIFSMKVTLADQLYSALETLLDGIEQNHTLPTTLFVKAQTIAEELHPTAAVLGFKIVVVKKFKTIPFVIRDIRAQFSRRIPIEESGSDAPEEMLFDDCEACRLQKEALLEGRTLSLEELKAAIKKARGNV